MADTVVGLQIRANAEEATKTVGNIKKELRQAQADAVAISAAFGELSPEAQQAAKRVAELRDAIADTNERVALFDPGNKFGVFTNTLQTAAAGFTAITGAAALFGSESEDLQKTLVKLQGAIALTQGLSAIADAQKDFQRLGVVAKQALAGIRTGIAATGIGVFVLALGAIVAYWDDIKEAVSGVSREQKQLNEDAQKQVDIEQQKLSTISDQDNVLRLQGVSEKEILQRKIDQNKEVVKAIKAQSVLAEQTLKDQIAAADRNQKYLRGFLDFISIPQRALANFAVNTINNLIGLINKIPGVNLDFKINDTVVDESTNFLSKLLFDPEATKAQGEADAQERANQIKKLENDIAGFQIQQNNLAKAGANTRNAIAKEEFEFTKQLQQQGPISAFNPEALKKQQEEAVTLSTDYAAKIAKLSQDIQLRNLTGIELEKAQTRLKYEEDLIAAGNSFALQLQLKQQFDRDFAALDQKAKDEERQREQALQAAKLGIVSGALGQLSDVVGRETAVGKGLAVAQATIDGFLAVQKALASAPPPFNFIAASAVGIATLANIRKIIATKVPGQASGGGTAPAGLGAAPPIPRPVQQSTRLDRDSINQIGNATARSFVLESDITNEQQRIRAVNRAARLG